MYLGRLFGQFPALLVGVVAAFLGLFDNPKA
jgi:hypothetical protein